MSSEDLSLRSYGETYYRNSSASSEKKVVVAWKNLKVNVIKKSPKLQWWNRQTTEEYTILDCVSGYCKSGVFTAVMGASGAGKTTLLATISQRAKMKTMGDILVNGRAVSRELMGKLSGFVPQHDLVYSTLTVNEHMEFMARLMMDQRVRRINRNRRIYCLLSELGLLRCCKTRLGHLSGGEIKRLSLAVQLLTDPPILFCDEPTTGLDSYSAGVVLEQLRMCAERGKAVLATIHQPASGLFEMFHEVVLLALGRVAYFGPVSEVSSYFNSVGLVCPPTYNPAEFYVQQLAVVPGKESESTERNKWLCDEFLASAQGQSVEQTVWIEMERGRNSYSRNKGLVKGNWSTHSSSTTDSAIDTELENEIEFVLFLTSVKPKKLTQLLWLIKRSFKDIQRNHADILLRFALFMGIAVLISTPYIGIMDDFNQRTIQNLQGLMYLVIVETIFTASYSVFHTFPREMPILLRELANGLYSPVSYYLSKMALIFFKAVIENGLFATFIFWVVPLNGGFLGCLFFVLPVIFAALSAAAYGTLMSAAFESIATANLVSVPVELIGLMFSGIYLNLSGVSEYLSWLKYLSKFYYGQEAVSISQWLQIDHIECPENPETPCIEDGEGALNKFGYHPGNYINDLLGLCFIYLVANLLGFLAMWKRSQRSPTY